MLCKTFVDTIFTRSNGYFEGRNFISKTIFGSSRKLYCQKKTDLLLFATIYCNRKSSLFHLLDFSFPLRRTQQTITSSKSTIEILEQGVKYVQSQKQKH